MRFRDLLEAFTPRQFIQTPAFKAWFGQSRVVDKHGQPLVVYHGTPVWEKDGRGIGDIMSFDRLGAIKAHPGRTPGMDTVGSWFSDSAGDDGAGMFAGSTGAIYPVYLSIKNPWKPNSFAHFLETMRTLAGLSKTPKYDPQTKMTPPAGRVSPEPLRDWLKSNGYDGIVFPRGAVDSKTDQVWVALEPQQIKSAVSQSAFSQNPNIIA